MHKFRSTVARIVLGATGAMCVVSCVSVSTLATRAETGDAIAVAKLLDLATEEGARGVACLELEPSACATDASEAVIAARALRRIAKSVKPLLSNVLSRSAPLGYNLQRAWVRRRHGAVAALLAARVNVPADEILQWYRTSAATTSLAIHDTSLRPLISLVVSTPAAERAKAVQVFLAGMPEAVFSAVEALKTSPPEERIAMAEATWNALGRVWEWDRKGLLEARGRVLRDRAHRPLIRSGAADEPTAIAVSHLWASAAIANWLSATTWRPRDTTLACHHMRWAVHRALLGGGRHTPTVMHWASPQASDYHTLAAFGRLAGDRPCNAGVDDSLVALLTDARIPQSFDVPLDAMVRAVSAAVLRDVSIKEIEKLIRQAGLHR